MKMTKPASSILQGCLEQIMTLKGLIQKGIWKDSSMNRVSLHLELFVNISVKWHLLAILI
jgi:hypothetical protein